MRSAFQGNYIRNRPHKAVEDYAWATVWYQRESSRANKFQRLFGAYGLLSFRNKAGQWSDAPGLATGSDIRNDRYDIGADMQPLWRFQSKQ